MPSIYTLSAASSPDVVRYVGATTRPMDVRFTQHVRSYNSDKSVYKRRWIAGLAESGDRLLCRVVDECLDGDVWEREKYWIAKFKADGARLTNIHEGGRGGSLTAESRKKISESLKGKKRPPHIGEQSRARGLLYVGEKNPNYGKTMQPHVKAALVKALTGKVYSDVEKAAMSQKHIERGINRKVTPETVVSVFDMRYVKNMSQQKIADSVGLSQTQISQILRGKKWSHLGLVEKYKC